VCAISAITTAGLLGASVFAASGADVSMALPPAKSWPAPTPSPIPSPTAEVAQAEPTHVAIPAIGVDADVKEFTLEDAAGSSSRRTGTSCLVDGLIICINPPLFDLAYWMRAGAGGIAYGDMPGTEAQGNVYLIAHASHQVEAVFTDLYQLAVGDEIAVTNENGELTYQVQEVVQVGKDSFTTMPQALEQVPGRLLLVTCYYGPSAEFQGGSAAANVVVVAQLTEGKPVDS